MTTEIVISNLAMLFGLYDGKTRSGEAKIAALILGALCSAWRSVGRYRNVRYNIYNPESELKVNCKLYPTGPLYFLAVISLFTMLAKPNPDRGLLSSMSSKQQQWVAIGGLILVAGIYCFIISILKDIRGDCNNGTYPRAEVFRKNFWPSVKAVCAIPVIYRALLADFAQEADIDCEKFFSWQQPVAGISLFLALLNFIRIRHSNNPDDRYKFVLPSMFINECVYSLVGILMIIEQSTIKQIDLGTKLAIAIPWSLLITTLAHLVDSAAKARAAPPEHEQHEQHQQDQYPSTQDDIHYVDLQENQEVNDSERRILVTVDLRSDNESDNNSSSRCCCIS